MSDAPTGYKLYNYVNTLYMSHKQFGIQTAHLVGELARRYMIVPHSINQSTSAKRVLCNYLNCGEPYIYMFDGMNVERLLQLEEIIARECEVSQLPHASFRESQAALAGAITTTGFVAPNDFIVYDEASSFATMTFAELYEASSTMRGVLSKPTKTRRQWSQHLLSELVRRSRFAN